MRRCFEQLPSRSQLCSHPIAPRLSFFRAGSSQKLFTSRLPSYAPPLPATQKSLSYSYPRNRSEDGSSPPPRDVSAPTQVRNTRKSKVVRRKRKLSRRDPVDWIAEVERFLPRHLSQLFDFEPRTNIPPEVNVEDVLRTLTGARDQDDVDVLRFMALTQRRYKAVVHLVETLLKAVALAANEPFKDELPSNITWPHGSFATRGGAPIELERTLHVSRRPLGGSRESSESILSEKSQERTMELIWSLLADLVLASTNCSSDEGKQIMNTVHQILALVHNLGLVPATIYTYSLPQGTTTVQQSPILHLLHSRILSTLSDAVWNAYQEEITARSAKPESSPWNIFREPPPSRLRPRRRELGPEVWLEFILWCCVEAGYAATGARIVRSLQTDVGGPWHAIRWNDDRAPSIDRDQQTRRRQLQSQEEVYQIEQLPVASPLKFISAEVVLAIVDCLINNIGVSAADSDVSVTNILNDINELISFAGPHGLAPAYFDYLAVRLLQTESMYNVDKADRLRELAHTISGLRSLRHVEQSHQQSSGLDFDSILDHSEVHAGILHQALQACVEANLVTKAVDTFTEIQKMVDGNKLEAIGEFLSLSLGPEDGFFTSRHAKGQSEFLNTYGQLPTYKLPPFLDLVSNAKLFGVGDWLLFSEDVDGAVLPSATWGKPSVTAALIRYASVKNDPLLVKHILNLTKRSARKLTVNVLRALVVHHINACDWTNAFLNLRDLRRAEGGGYSPKIVASLAAKILNLEVDPAVTLQEEAESDVSQAMLLLCNILDGIYDSPPAGFRIDQKKTFRQQVGYLLRLMENVSDSKIADAAARFKPRFPVSNEPNLATDTFNVLFAAIVEIKGVLEGRDIWYLFCKDPRDHATSSPLLVDGHDPASEDHATVEDEDEFFDGKENDVPNELGGVGEHGEDNFSLRMRTVDPPISDAIQDAGAQIPVAMPVSLNINVAFPHEDLDSTDDQFYNTSGEGNEDTEIPIETVDIDVDSIQPHLNPIVVPNMRTLQILVRGALSEIQARKDGGRSHRDLDAVLKWAEKFYGAFNLAREDIETEFRASESLPKNMRIATKHPRAAFRSSSREKFKVGVGKHFTKGVFVPRRPGTREPGREATSVNGADDMAEVAAVHETKEGEVEGGNTQVGLAAIPSFKLRKFATSVRHA